MKKILAFLFAISLFYFVGAQSVLASSNFNVEVRTYLDGSNMNQAATGLTNQARGSKVQFNASGISPEYTFAFYAVNDIVRDDLPVDYEFVVRSNMKITAFFRPNVSVTPANARHVVIFADNNGKIIAGGVQYVQNGGTATQPEVLPNKPNAEHADPKWFSVEAELGSLSNITSSRVYLLQYVSTDNTAYTVNVTGGSVVEDAPNNYNDVVTLQPNAAPAEQVFSHWEDAEGNVLSTKANYKFTVMGNVSVQAVFAATPEFNSAVVNMSDALSIRSGYVTYKGQFDLPAGFTLVEYGFIFSRSSDVLTLDSLGATIVPSNVHNGQTGEFLRSFPNNTFNSVRAYLIVKNVAQEEVIVYSYNYYLNESLSAPELIDTVDFEVSSGFTNGTVYNSLTVKNDGPTNKQWGSVYGTVSSTDPIANSSSAQMRWYSANPSNLGYFVMNYTITDLSYITFLSSSTGGNSVKVEYSVNGSSFTGAETFSLTTTPTSYQFNINQTGDIKVRFTLVSGGVNGSRLYIDNVSFYRLGQPSPSQIVHEVQYNDDSLTIEFVQNAALISTPSKSKTGYTFNGWYTDVTLTQSYNVSSPVVQSLQLYSKWTINEYTITFNSAGGSSVSPITQNYNTAVLAPADPTREGYSFTGWSPAVPANMPANNLELTAQWSINQYTITFDSNEGSAVSPITQNFGTSVSAPANPTREGFIFQGWYTDDGTFLNEYVFSTIPSQNLTLFANWVPATGNEFVVNFNINGGSGSVDQQVVSENGNAIEPTDPTRSGYRFVEWQLDGEPFIFTTPITADITLIAVWIQQFTVTFNTNGGTAVTSQIVDIGFNATAPSPNPTKSGQSFSGWYADEALTTVFVFASTPITSDLMIYAKWNGTLMIYEINPAGGNTGATYNRDYVVLYNGSNSSINLSGYTIQYASATGTFSVKATLSGTINAGQYYLIADTNAGAVGSNLPVAANFSVSGGLGFGGTAGKVVLANNNTIVTAVNSSNVVDYVGYGNATAYEGTGPTPATSSTLSIKRTQLIDLNNNSTDFVASTPDLSYLSNP